MSRRLAQLSGKPRRVEVEWIDSGRSDGWNGASEILADLDQGVGALTCWTTGYLIDDRPETVTVALSYTIDARTGLHDEYGSPLTIPRVAIVTLRELRR